MNLMMILMGVADGQLPLDFVEKYYWRVDDAIMYMILVAIAAFILGPFMYFWVGWIVWKKQRMLRFPLSQQTSRDARRASKEITEFLYRRLHDCSRLGDIDQGNIHNIPYARYFLGDEPCYWLTVFVRVCHMVGCEVVIRQVDTHDIDERQEKMQMLADKCKIIKAQEVHGSIMDDAKYGIGSGWRPTNR